MSGPTVKCEVNTCTHWIPSNICGAENIDILTEQAGASPGGAEQTECKTFAQRRGLTSILRSMDNVNWGGMMQGVLSPERNVTPSVTCTVDSCTFWEDGNRCKAEEIFVSGQNASECEETNCHTFQAKG